MRPGGRRQQTPTTIATDDRHLGASMRGQPRSECRRFPVRQEVKDEVNHAPLFEVYQQRAVARSTPEGEVIHAEQTQIRCDLADGGNWRATDQAQQAIAARPVSAQMQSLRQSSSRLAT